MTDDPDKPGGDGTGDSGFPPLEPFQTYTPENPFPPLDESLGTTSPADPPSDWNQRADAHDLAVAHVVPPHQRLIELSRFAFPPEPAPDDEALAARDRRWTTRTVVVATLFLLVFNAVSPLNWSRQQAPSWVQATVRDVSEVWNRQLAPFGVDQPRQGTREVWMAARDTRFPGQEPAQTAP